jgi:hypothetical protein
MTLLRIKIKNNDLREFQNKAINIVKDRILKAMDKMDSILFKESERLAKLVTSSDEFQLLKTPLLIGRFGFTPSEVNRLNELEPLIGPNNNNSITQVVKRLGIKNPRIELKWVDFDNLKNHDSAQHPLTKFDSDSRSFIDTGTTVSWIEWWEEGVVIRGHVFSRLNQISSEFSRSGEGIMRKARGGGFFMLQPTRIFEKIGDTQAKEVTRRIDKALRSLVRSQS